MAGHDSGRLWPGPSLPGLAESPERCLGPCVVSQGSQWRAGPSQLRLGFAAAAVGALVRGAVARRCRLLHFWKAAGGEASSRCMPTVQLETLVYDFCLLQKHDTTWIEIRA